MRLPSVWIEFTTAIATPWVVKAEYFGKEVRSVEYTTATALYCKLGLPELSDAFVY